MSSAPDAVDAGGSVRTSESPTRGASRGSLVRTAALLGSAVLALFAGWAEAASGFVVPALLAFAAVAFVVLGLGRRSVGLALLGVLGGLLGSGGEAGHLARGLVAALFGAGAGLAIRRLTRSLPERPVSSFLRVQALVLPVAVLAAAVLALLRQAVGVAEPGESFATGIAYLLPGVLLALELAAAVALRRQFGRNVAGAPALAALIAVGVTAAAIRVTVADWRHQDDANLSGAAATASNVLQQTLTGDVGVLLARATNPPQSGWTSQGLFDRSSRVLLLAQPTLTALELVSGAGGSVETQYESGSQGYDPKAAAMFLPNDVDRRAVAQVTDAGGFRVVGIRDVADASGRGSPNLIVFASVGGASHQALGMAVSLGEALRLASLSVGGTTGETDFALSAAAPGSKAPTTVAAMHAGELDASDAGTDPTLRSAVESFQLGDVTFAVTSYPAGAIASAQRFRRLVLAGEVVAGLGLVVILLQAAMAAYRRRIIESEQKELLEAAVAGAPGVVLVLDQQLRILASSASIGVGELSDGDSSLFQLLPFRASHDDEQRVRQVVQDAVGGSESRIEVVDAAGGDKIRIFELVARPVRRGGDGSALVWLASADVTDARMQEMRAEQSERLESLGIMARGLAHDFNNLLFIISGYLQLAQDSPAVAQAPDLSGYVEHALDAAGRGAAIASSLLSVAGGGAMQRSTVGLPGFFDRLFPLAQRAVGERRRLEFVEPVPDVSLVVDVGQLTNALINLLINARDATPEDGHVRVAAEVVPDPNSEHASLDWIRLTVSDDGEGMSAETQARAFEPYFTTKVPEQGTGLGLATAYAFVRHSQGDITIESELGRGSRISILLPLTSTLPPLETYPEHGVVDSSRVLVVDNESSLVLLVSGWLRSFGLDVRTAESPDEALKVFDEFQPGLVVTDMNLGTDLTGLDVAAHIAFRDPDVRVVFMTGFSDQMQKLVERGLPVLAKPFGKDALRGLVGADAAATRERGVEVQRA